MKRITPTNRGTDAPVGQAEATAFANKLKGTMTTNQELKDAITEVINAWEEGDLAAAVRNAASLAAEPAPDSTYLVAWIGGAEVPSYQAFDNEDDAFDRAEDWYTQAEEGIDSIDVLKITGTVVERLQRKQA